MQIVHLTPDEIIKALDVAPSEAKNFITKNQATWFFAMALPLSMFSIVSNTGIFTAIIASMTFWYTFSIAHHTILSLQRYKRYKGKKNGRFA